MNGSGAEAFPGELPRHRMRKLARPRVGTTCGSCRRFDGLAWCRRWNYHTGADSPICPEYRAAGGQVAAKKAPPAR